MKPLHTLPFAAKAGAIASIFAVATIVPGSAQVVDPDPELFDGSHTKTEEKEEEKQVTVDDWEGANLIIYDSDEQGSQRGGMGRAGHENPGMDMGSGSGMGGMGLPIPMGGGGASLGGSGLEIPEMQQPGGGGEENAEQKDAAGGGNPQGTQAGQGAQQGGGRQAPQKPGDVAIGDDSQRIQQSGAPPVPVGDTSGLEKTAQDSTSDGGDDTQMKAASGAQSGKRGGGVEKGDAIPTDL